MNKRSTKNNKRWAQRTPKKEPGSCTHKRLPGFEGFSTCGRVLCNKKYWRYLKTLEGAVSS